MAEESLLQFPCELPIKVLGRNDQSFRSEATRIVRSHVGTLDDGRVSEQQSRNQSYLSLTFLILAESREHVDSLYRDLTASDEIMMVF
ncbi:MAG TPA: DUF493 domain-containing protein [Gammaproteobacteria bacterium]